MDAKRLAEFDRAYLQIAHTWSTLSRARRKQVGCIVVKDGSIISDGFNGTPSGFDNNCEYETRFGYETRVEVLHAESNAITKLAKSTVSSQGATMYITISPCMDCAKLIIQAGIKRVVYGDIYRSTAGVELLEKASIITEEIKL